MKTSIIDYNAGNLFSIKNAVESLQMNPTISNDQKEILSSDCVILPGVGSFKDSMKFIKKNKLDLVIKEYISLGKPFIGICLGMQLLFSKSEEFGISSGLAILRGDIKLLPSHIDDIPTKVPNIGWNEIEFTNKSGKDNSIELYGIPNKSHMYFVHSYYCDPKDDIIVANTNFYGFKYAAAIKSKNIFATQFHPEKSGKIGIELLNNVKQMILNKEIL